MVLVSIRLQVPLHKQAEIVNTIHSFMGPTSVEPGCLSIRCLQDTTNEGSIVVEERWRSQEDLERHIKSSDYRAFLSVLEAAAKKPVVEFHSVSKTRGMEMIQELIGRIESTDRG